MIRCIACRSARAARPALDVVLLGDSVLASVENGPGERLTDFLPGEVGQALAVLHGKSARLVDFQFGCAGGRSACSAENPMRGSQRRRKGLRDLVVVISSNPVFSAFCIDAMNYPVSVYALADDPLLLPG